MLETWDRFRVAMRAYDESMSQGRITVSLPVRQIEAAKRAVAEGRAESVSAYVSEALDISCDNMCDYQLPMGSVVTLSPVETTAGWTFELWNSTPCFGQTPDCTLTLSADQQTARARFENN